MSSLGFVVLARRPNPPHGYSYEPVSAVFPEYPKGLEQAQNVRKSCEESHLAPHETRATLRLKQAGWPGGEMHRVLKMTATKLIGSLREGMDEESNARASGRQIVGGTVDRGTV